MQKLGKEFLFGNCSKKIKLLFRQYNVIIPMVLKRQILTKC